MKKMFIFRIMAFLFTAAIFFVACTKEEENDKLAPQVSAAQLLNVTSDSATVVGFIIAAGDGFTEKGMVYNTDTLPTIANSKNVYKGKSTGATYTMKIGALAYATKYYVRAYATSSTVTIYGEGFTLTTLPVVPTLTTDAITAITGNKAAGGGNVTVNGGAAVTARGVVFATFPNPTIADGKTTDGDNTGAFVSALSGLLGNATYYVRAYATNSAGTGYGPEVTFTTLVDLPVITTAAVTGLTKVAAISGGNLTYDGGGAVSARGIVWGMNANPTLADNTIAGGTGNGEFVSNISGLTKYTTYHVRAYATNSAGTSYGADIQFTTLSDILTWNIPGNYVGASYPGSALADWSPDKSPQVISTVTAPDNLEGYVYMANAMNEWKFATQLNWDGPNYGAGSAAGTLDASGPNISSPSGYYKINVNGAALTYTAVATVWGVIGNATPGDWSDETALTYNPTLASWTGGIHFTAGEFKFRANHNWDYNYGSTSKDANLNAGGDNIPVTVADDYAITLDLSHPNAYTYSANRWGVIGSATPGGWDSDQNLIWDATNKVFKITLSLVVGEFKFRTNDAWDFDFGGDINALTKGGANIAVTAAGTYTITLDPWGRKATFTLGQKK